MTRLEDHLRDTFRAHEHLADAPTTRVIEHATPVPSRRNPRLVAAAAVLALGLGLGYAVLSTGNDGGDGTASSPASSPAASPTNQPTLRAESTTYEENYAAAKAEVARILTVLPMPDGAERLPNGPTWWSNTYNTSLGPSDPSLSKVVWWRADGLTRPDAANFFTTTAADDMYVTPAGSTSTDRQGRPAFSAEVTQTESPQPMAFLPVRVSLTWVTSQGSTWVRAETFTAAHTARQPDSIIGGEPTSAKVTTFLGDENTHVLRGTTDSELVTVLDLSPGSIKPPFTERCPAARPAVKYQVDVVRGDARWTFTLAPACAGQVTVQRDGVPLDGTLDPTALAEFLDARYG